MDRSLPSSRIPAFNRNLLLFPTISPQPTSSTLRTTARGPSLPRQSRTPNLLTSLVSHLWSNLIRLVPSLSSLTHLTHPASTAPAPTLLGPPSGPLLPFPLSSPAAPRPPTARRLPATVIPTHPTPVGLCQTTP